MHSPARPFGFARDQFLLDPTWTFLNHGSFGAVPATVRAAQAAWRAEVEAQPVAFLARRWWSLVDRARQPIAEFLGAPPDHIAFVSNATAGVQAVVRSTELTAGDRVVTTCHRYDAVQRILRHATDARGAEVVEVDPGRHPSAAALAASVLAACSERTRLVVVDAITSPTAEVFALDPLVSELRSRGIPVLVDGAHAPGLIDINLAALGADYWVGNLHKWTCAPRGTAVLYVAPRHHDRIRAPITSHGHGLGFHAEFDWTGTFDPTGWLSAPTAIEQHAAWGGPELRLSHRLLAAHYRSRLRAALGRPSTADDTGLPACAMVVEALGVPDTHIQAGQAWLAAQRVEAPLIPWRGQTLIRVSAFAAYNRPEDVEGLVACLPGLLQVLRTGTAA